MWLGVDGEGIGRHPHRYVMLCCNDSGGSAGDYIEDVNGLSSEDCLQWFLDVGDKRELAGYYLTYDWTKILSDLPDAHIWALLRPEYRLQSDSGRSFTPVKWKGFELHYLAGMMRIKKGKREAVVWDVGKYYQSRFVAALESSGFAPTDLIARMKEERGGDNWNESRLDSMREYCLEECQYLAKLVELLEKQHHAIGIKPLSWHGPGSTAGALLEAKGVRNHIVAPTADMQHVAECAYFGGRFEHAVGGTRLGCWSYDVRSAYPAATVTLPCLLHAKWKKQSRLPSEDEIAAIKYRVSDIGDRVWGPLPCRLEDGSIVWSRGGHSGWAWSVEYWPARRGWKGVEFAGEAWVLHRQCDCQPFEFLKELYQWRVSRPENKQVVKLAINSVYGKLAQTVGGGKYASRIWAGIITATCRARMLELITQHHDESNLYAIATDGAYSSERLNIEGPGLGEWEVDHKGEMVFLRPGIYWSMSDVREWYGKQDAKSKDRALKAVKARGVGRKTMLEQLEHARTAVESGEARVRLGTSTQFGNARECVYRTPSGEIRRSKAYGEWLDMPVSLSLKPEPKRAVDWRPPMLAGVTSVPYDSAPKSPDGKVLQMIGSMLEGRL